MHDWLARFVVRQKPAFAAISRMPVIGPIVRAVGRSLLPRGNLVWLQIEGGAGKGLWMELNPRTGEAYFRGNGEPSVQDFVTRQLKPGMVFYDLGANCGYFSVIAARCVGASGHVTSFEPERGLADRVRANMKRNAFDHFDVVEAAAWRVTGTLSFALSDSSNSPDQGTGKVTSSNGRGGTVQISGVALDDFVKNARPPDFIKCDVEGAEVDVFRGASHLLSTSHPIIVCEVHSAELGKTLREDLQRFGYTVSDLDENHICAEFLQQ